MPRRRSNSSSGRGRRRRTASRAAPDYLEFDANWLARIRERFDARYVDITKASHRQRWAPRADWGKPARYNSRGPRVVVVPEHHPLARFATYGGRVPLGRIYAQRNRKRMMVQGWGTQQLTDPRGFKYQAKVFGTRLAAHVGVHLPWQVIVCVRRKQRREVMHALNIAGRRGVGAGKPQRRSAASKVEC